MCLSDLDSNTDTFIRVRRSPFIDRALDFHTRIIYTRIMFVCFALGGLRNGANVCGQELKTLADSSHLDPPRSRLAGGSDSMTHANS